MEPEFGRFFLSNFRNASLPASSSHQLYPLEATESPKPVPLPPLQRTCDTESTTPGSSGLFRLAPPPPNQFAVGVRTSGEQVVKIETLQEQKAAPSISKAEEPEDYGPTGAVFVDDEEGLLGDDVPKSPSGVPPAGATRDFESDDEDEAMAPQEQAPPPVEAPVELPPPQPLKGVEREEVEPEREKPEVEEGVEATAVATPPTLPMQAAPPAASPAAASAPPRHPPSVPSEAAPAEAVFEVPHPVLSPVHAGAHALGVPRMTMEMAPIETAEPPAPPRPIMPGQVQTFRISVPPPFPGVQIRKSTNIEDKHDRFLQDGKEVRGKVDASGQWVKLKSKHYLPMKVGNIQVLHVVDPKEPAAATLSPEVVPVPVEEDETNFWFTCCAGSAAVAEGNDLHVTPEDRGNYGTLDGSGDVLTPVVLSNGKVAHTFPQPPSSGTRSGAPKAVPNRAQAGVVDLPRHISNPIDPFSDR